MSSTNQNPPDSVLLASLGESVIHALVETYTFTLIYGVFVLLFSQTTVTYLKKKQASRAQRWMFLASATTFLLATIQEAAMLAGPGILIHSTLVGYPGLSLIEKRPLVNGRLTGTNLIEDWIARFEAIISDSVVVWRAIVLLGRRKWLKILPLVLLLASFASCLVHLTFRTLGADVNHGFLNNFVVASYGLSLGTNIVATALIGYIYWLHRKDMITGQGKHRSTQVERVLVMLVESGIVFSLLQAVGFILGFLPITLVHGTAGDFANTIFQTVYHGFSTIYPTMVVALVNGHRTFDHMYSTNASLPTISRGVDPEHTTKIQFAEANPTTSARTLSQLEKCGDAQMA